MWIVAAVIIVIIVIAGVYFAFYTAKAADVSILDDSACASNATACKYDPTSFSTTVGKEITWKNNGGVTHTVHSCTTGNTSAQSTAACPNGLNQGAAAGKEIASGNLVGGDTFKVTFSAAGTYNYFCNIHLWMHGTVTVS